MIDAWVVALLFIEPAATTAPPQRETADVRAEPRVLVVTGRSETRAEDSTLRRVRRTQAELEAAGFDVLEIGLTASIEEIDAARIDELTREHDASAVTVLHPQQRHASIWTLEGDVAQRRAIVVGSNQEHEPDAVFALRVAEVVRATLIPVESQPVATEPEPSRPQHPPVELAPTKGPRWGARVGLHGVGVASNLGFMLGPTLGASVAVGPRRRVAFDVETLATAREGRVRSSAGEASVGFANFRATAAFWPLPQARVSPGFGVGWGMLVAWTRGHANAPYRGRVDTTIVSTPVGAADLAIPITPRLRVRIGVRIGVALPAIRIQAESAAKRTAQPIADGGVGLEVIGPPRRRG